MKDITCTAQTTSTLTVETGITDMGTGEFVEKGFLWRAGSSGNPTLDNCDNSMKVDGTERSTYSATITDLQVGTSYRVRGYVKTTMDGATVIAYTEAITGTTIDKANATMKTISTTLDGDCTISATCGISNLGTGELVEKGFCWKIDDTPSLDNCDGHTAVSDGSDESYSATIENLHYNSTYFVRAYAKTVIEGDTLLAYSSFNQVLTKSIRLYDSVYEYAGYIIIKITFEDNYADLFTESSAAIVEQGGISISVNDESFVKDTGSGITLTGVESDSTIKIRMRAKHKDGYYIYQDTNTYETLKTPSKEDIDNPEIIN
jgi:hypothetical protein